MIKAVIVDDSIKAIDSLSGLLKIYLPQVELLGYAEDVDSGIAMINKLEPELVFLDIEINTKTGFDLLKAFPVINFEIIFVTGFNNYAIEAFNYNALHYLVKPIVPEKLIEAVNRLNKHKSDINIEKVKNLLGINDMKYHTERRIAFNTEKEKRIVLLKDILHIKGEGRYSMVYLNSGEKILVTIHLKELEKQLALEEFFRIGKSNIINLNHVAMIKHIDGGTIEMKDGTRITIPRRKRDEFDILMAKYLSWK